jgi:hypothetical protein
MWRSTSWEIDTASASSAHNNLDSGLSLFCVVLSLCLRCHQGHTVDGINIHIQIVIHIYIYMIKQFPSHEVMQQAILPMLLVPYRNADPVLRRSIISFCISQRGTSERRNLVGSTSKLTTPRRPEESALPDGPCSFNRPMEKAPFPDGLRCLSFGYSFNRPMEKAQFPDGLSFGVCFNQPMEKAQFPEYTLIHSVA